MSAELEYARTLLGNALGMAPGSIALHATVNDLDAWDSLGHMRIVAAIELETGATLSPEQIIGLSSLKNVVELLAGMKI